VLGGNHAFSPHVITFFARRLRRSVEWSAGGGTARPHLARGIASERGRAVPETERNGTRPECRAKKENGFHLVLDGASEASAVALPRVGAALITVAARRAPLAKPRQGAEMSADSLCALKALPTVFKCLRGSGIGPARAALTCMQDVLGYTQSLIAERIRELGKLDRRRKALPPSEYVSCRRALLSGIEELQGVLSIIDFQLGRARPAESSRLLEPCSKHEASQAPKINVS
jgi:hypothetical protein